MQKINKFEQKLQVLCTLFKNFELSKISTIKIGGKARYYAQVHSIKNLRKIIVLCTDFKVKFFVVGNCSNILFLDGGFDGVVVSLCGLKTVKISANVVYAQAGTSLASLAQIALKNNLSGLEWSVGIPASVGGAVAMNAGAFNGDVCSVLQSVDALNVNTLEIENFDNLEYLGKYHQSVFTNNKNYVILSAKFALCPKPHEQILARMHEVAGVRAERQNVGFPSLGSVFCRGNSEFAPAFYIEQLGLKGFCIGGAQVSKVHSGYIVNCGGATAKDVLRLVKHIKDLVFLRYKVKLETEILVVGEDNGHKWI